MYAFKTFMCLNVALNSYSPDNIKQTKVWASSGIHLTVYSVDQDVVPTMLMTHYQHMALILDLNCSGSGDLLAQVRIKVYLMTPKIFQFVLCLISQCVATKFCNFDYFREFVNYTEYVALDELLG
jgi:hypothetical protein